MYDIYDDKCTDIVSLRSLLNFLDFDYEIINENGEDVIKLIDLMDVYYGDLREWRFSTDTYGIDCIIYSLNRYWDDYVINDLIEMLEKLKIDIDYNMSLTDLYKISEIGEVAESLKRKIVYFMLHPDKIIIDELETKEKENVPN